MSCHIPVNWVPIWNCWQRGSFFSQEESFRGMILRDIWKKCGIFKKRNKGFIYRILDTEKNKLSQSFCHFLNPSQNLSQAWIMSDICYLESGTLVIYSTFNNVILNNNVIIIWLPIIIITLTTFPLKARQAEFPCGIDSLRCLSVLKGKDPKWTP